jgi:cytochrome c biogenesis protein CcmG, thiol:disulfide interchange protein DsbE
MTLDHGTLSRLAPIGLFAVLAIGLAFALTNDPRKMPSMLIDRPAPKLALAALEGSGDKLTNADLDGKVALLNVFASWCQACRVEHPTLIRLTREKVIPLYGIDWKDKPGDGARWLKVHANPYLKTGDDPDGRTGIDMGVTGTPDPSPRRASPACRRRSSSTAPGASATVTPDPSPRRCGARRSSPSSHR